jgi:hypothetical protein
MRSSSFWDIMQPTFVLFTDVLGQHNKDETDTDVSGQPNKDETDTDVSGQPNKGETDTDVSEQPMGHLKMGPIGGPETTAIN